MTADERPTALPPAGGSTLSRFDPRTPDLSGENLMFGEACSLFRVSDRTLRRQLSAGQIAAAIQRGRPWVKPRASIANLYELKEPAVEPVVQPPTQSNEPEPQVLELLSQLLGRESKVQAQLEAMTERLLESGVRAARADEQAKVLTLELESLKQRRRLIKTKPKES
jgi:hypothetical protein